MRFFLYVRKSSESDDRQALSIESQIETLQTLADRRGITIVHAFEESKSAKQPGRPVFNEMLGLLEAKEADGILCWKLDRLSRNPVDTGRISWNLQQGIIKRIVTHDRDYLPDDNVLLQSVEFGMANQYLRDLSKNVKRGMDTKLKNGWLPRRPPIGYMNDPVTRTIVPDPHNFPLMKQLLEAALTRAYHGGKLCVMANNLGIRAREKGVLSTKPPSKAQLYINFIHPFYAGIIRSGGVEYPGKHEPMITLEQHRELVKLFEKKSKRETSLEPQKETPRTTAKRSYRFNGLIKCPCGRHVCPWRIRNRQENGKQYLYYVCSRRFRAPNKMKCNEPAVRAEELEKQIRTHLEHIRLPQEFTNWFRDNQSNLPEPQKNDEDLLFSLKTRIGTLESKRAKLLDFALDTSINAEEFNGKKDEIDRELTNLREQEKAVQERITNRREEARTAVDLSARMLHVFDHGTDDEVKRMLKGVVARMTLASGLVQVEVRRPFVVGSL
jgi:DNA invertase Pin-like site-specific DNA recombinase